MSPKTINKLLTVGFFLQWGAAVLEFGTTYLLLQQDGKVTKEDLRGVYDVGPLLRISKPSTIRLA